MTGDMQRARCRRAGLRSVFTSVSARLADLLLLVAADWLLQTGHVLSRNIVPISLSGFHNGTSSKATLVVVLPHVGRTIMSDFI